MLTVELTLLDGRTCVAHVSGHTDRELVLKLLREMKAQNPRRHLYVELDGVPMHIRLDMLDI